MEGAVLQTAQQLLRMVAGVMKMMLVMIIVLRM